MRLMHGSRIGSALLCGPIMVMLHCINTVHPAGHKTAGEPAREGTPPLIKTLTSKYSAWRRFRESVRELSRLSDRELNDLGIGRSDIVTVCKQRLA